MRVDGVSNSESGGGDLPALVEENVDELLILPPYFHLKLDEGSGLTAEDSGNEELSCTLSAGCSWIEGETPGSHAVRCPLGEGISTPTGMTKTRFDQNMMYEWEFKFRCTTSGPGEGAILMRRFDGIFSNSGEKYLSISSDNTYVASYAAGSAELIDTSLIMTTGNWVKLKVRGGVYGYIFYADLNDGNGYKAYGISDGAPNSDNTSNPFYFGNSFETDPAVIKTIDFEWIKYRRLF